MARRLLKIVSRSLTREFVSQPPAHTFAVDDVIWAMGSFCALNSKPFDAELLSDQSQYYLHRGLDPSPGNPVNHPPCTSCISESGPGLTFKVVAFQLWLCAHHVRNMAVEISGSQRPVSAPFRSFAV